MPVRRVQYAIAGLDGAGVDAEIGELADERVGHHLEDECRERRVGRCLARGLDILARVDALNRGDIKRTREVVDDAIEQRLHTLVLERRTQQNRRDRVGKRSGAERAADHLGRDGALVLEVGLGQLVVELGDRVDQRVVVLLRLLEQFGRISPMSIFVPRSSDHVTAFISTRSMIPTWCSSWPIGSCTGTARAPSRSRID